MIVLLFTVLSALYDKGKRFENHALRAIFRAVVILLISICEMPTILVGVYAHTIHRYFLNAAIFYMVFDYLLNILEGRRWNYIGSTAVIDTFWNKLGGWVPQLLFKVGLLFLTFKLK